MLLTNADGTDVADVGVAIGVSVWESAVALGRHARMTRRRSKVEGRKVESLLERVAEEAPFGPWPRFSNGFVTCSTFNLLILRPSDLRLFSSRITTGLSLRGKVNSRRVFAAIRASGKMAEIVNSDIER